jgi:hypothetical protein
VLNLYEMEQFDPKNEEELDNVTVLRLSLLKQLYEMKEIESQIKNYLATVEQDSEVAVIDIIAEEAVEEIDAVDNGAQTDFVDEEEEDDISVMLNDEAIALRSVMNDSKTTHMGWTENAQVKEFDLEEDVEDEDAQTDMSYDTRMHRYNFHASNEIDFSIRSRRRSTRTPQR